MGQKMDRFLREMDNRGARIRGKMISEQLDREFEQKIKPLLKQLRPLMKNVMYQRGLKNSLSRIANRVAKVAEKNAPLSQRPESKNPNKRSKKSIHGGASYYWKGNLKISMRNAAINASLETKSHTELQSIGLAPVESLNKNYWDV